MTEKTSEKPPHCAAGMVICQNSAEVVPPWYHHGDLLGLSVGIGHGELPMLVVKGFLLSCLVWLDTLDTLDTLVLC